MTSPASPSAPAPQPRGPGLDDLVSGYLHTQFDAIDEGDRALREGLDRIYPTRVAVRRTRSTLRTFADLFEPSARRQFDHELRWWAGLLGEVRDRAVQIAAIDDLAPQLDTDGSIEAARTFVVAALVRQRDQALRAVEAELAKERQPHVHVLVERWRQPPFTQRAGASGNSVSGYVERARGRLEAALATARRPGAASLDVHHARKAGKRYRYALELASPRLGPLAPPALERARALQDELGRYQDSVVGVAFLGNLVRSEPIPAAVGAGVERLCAELATAGQGARQRALGLML